MSKRTAVIMIHGIGEQVPMETLKGFVKAVWTEDQSLMPGKPHPDAGADRKVDGNASWAKPDERTGNFDLHLISTESLRTEGGKRKRVEFFEFYWAHRISNTAWDQFRSWLFGLMLRNPFTRVPRGVRLAWFSLWLLTALAAYAILTMGWVMSAAPIPFANSDNTVLRWIAGPAAWLKTLPGWLTTAIYLAGAFLAAKLVSVLTHVAGDVVRYVEASPKNIAIRQAIREDGVRLLETLMGYQPDGSRKESGYDRIIVVGHSLGTIVAYDLLTHAFGRRNVDFDPAKLAAADQGALTKIERSVAAAWSEGGTLNDKEFRKQQDQARDELQEAGHPWIVSDFISIGSPLTHAEFLMAKTREDVRTMQADRLFPTCPPTLERGRSGSKASFTYSASKAFAPEELIDEDGNRISLAGKRVPHHAALFAFTRWTNIYSPTRMVVGGDIVSGPLRNIFGLLRKQTSGKQSGEQVLGGILDVPVFPSTVGTRWDQSRQFLTHLKYWDLTAGKSSAKDNPAQAHIQILRNAMNLREDPDDPLVSRLQEDSNGET